MTPESRRSYSAAAMAMLLVAVAAHAGCRADGVVKRSAVACRSEPYRAVDQPLFGSRATLVAAVLYLVKQQSLELATLDVDNGVVVAQSAVQSASGVPTRERWTFVLGDHRARIGLALDARFDESGSPWRSADRACSAYEYRREREQMQRLVQVASYNATYLAKVPFDPW